MLPPGTVDRSEYPGSRRDLIRETVAAWIYCYPEEAKAFAKQLKYNAENQNKGGAWGVTKAGYKKYTLPADLFYTLLAIFKHYNEQPLFGTDDSDIRCIAQEFPDFLCRMNIDKEAKRIDRRKRTLLT